MNSSWMTSPLLLYGAVLTFALIVPPGLSEVCGGDDCGDDCPLADGKRQGCFCRHYQDDLGVNPHWLVGECTCQICEEPAPTDYVICGCEPNQCPPLEINHVNIRRKLTISSNPVPPSKTDFSCVSRTLNKINKTG